MLKTKLKVFGIKRGFAPLLFFPLFALYMRNKLNKKLWKKY